MYPAVFHPQVKAVVQNTPAPLYGHGSGRTLGPALRYPAGIHAGSFQLQKVIMPLLRVSAEHLKLDLNERCGEDYSSGWDDDDEEISLNTGGRKLFSGHPGWDI